MNGGMIIGEHRFEIDNRRDEEHFRPQCSGARESLAIPSEMLSHPPELTAAPLRFKCSCMLQEHAEPRCEVGCPWECRYSSARLDSMPSLFLVSEKPWSAERRPSDQHAVHARLTDTTHDLT